MDNSAFSTSSSNSSSNPSSISSSNSSSSSSTMDGVGASADNASLLLVSVLVPAFDSSSHHHLPGGTAPMMLAGTDNDNNNDNDHDIAGPAITHSIMATPAPDIMPESTLVDPHNLPNGRHDSPAFPHPHLVFGSSSSSSSSSMIEDYYRDLLIFHHHDSASASSFDEMLIDYVDNMPSVTVDGEGGGGPGQAFDGQQSAAASSLLGQSLHDLDAMEVNDDHMHSEAKNVEVVCFNMRREDSTYDGYTWRKYGQKAIKGRRFPRSYYRCAHPGCPIKKQIENSSEKEDYVTIMYIGRHNHH